MEIAVRHLEDNPVFNAGHGSVFNTKGEVEMDALIMDGATLQCGAVGAVRNIGNPVSLARMVMDDTEHVLLVGTGANDFAKKMNVPECDPSELVSAYAKKRWEEFHKYQAVTNTLFNNPTRAEESAARKEGKERTDCPVQQQGHDTVGAVTIDLQGNIACATSTGGITHKMPGRVGDSPLIGSGGYADNTVGGISTTGHGESIAKVTLATRALFMLQQGGANGNSSSSSSPSSTTQPTTAPVTPQRALEGALQFMLQRVGGRGGMILITREGQLAKAFTTERMSWASVNQSGVLESGV